MTDLSEEFELICYGPNIVKLNTNGLDLESLIHIYSPFFGRSKKLEPVLHSTAN